MEFTIDELRMQLEESQQKLKIMMQHNDELKLQLIVEKSKNELQISK